MSNLRIINPKISFGAFTHALRNKALPAEVIAKIETAIVEKVIINEAKRTWSIFLKAETEIDQEIEDILSSALLDVVGGLQKVEFHFMDKEVSNLDGITERLRKEVKKELIEAGKEAVFFGWLKNARWVLQSDTICIEVSNQIGVMKLSQEKVAEKVKEIAAMWGLDIQCKITVGDFPRYQEVEKVKEPQVIALAKEKVEPKSGELSTVKNRKKVFKKEIVQLSSIVKEEQKIAVCGEIFNLEVRELKGKKQLLIFMVTDNTDSITVKYFTKKNEELPQLANGQWVYVEGDVCYDNYARELVLMANRVAEEEKKERMDESEQKRVELHLHTKMSAMDATVDIKELFATLKKWGHSAVAITDHGVVQAFPEAYEEAEKTGIKLIYGLEGYFVDDGQKIIATNPGEKQIRNADYVVFDVETTGLDAANDKIIEIGAVKIVKGEIIDTFAAFINPQRPLPENIKRLTGITDEMLVDAPLITEVLPKFFDFVGQESVLVAHNASFDLAFLNENAEYIGMAKWGGSVIDTLALSRAILTNIRSHKLNKICEALDIPLKNHHRAIDDARATAQVLLKLLQIIQDRGINYLKEINDLIQLAKIEQLPTYHITLLAKNYLGLRNLYKIVSASHINCFYRVPRIPKSLLEKYREGIIVGSACEGGELFQSLLRGKSEKEIERIAEYYDYLEIQPIENNSFLLREGKVESRERLREMNETILKLGKKLGKPVVAACDVHFLEPEHHVFRKILMGAQKYKDYEHQPPLYLRTTEEMLQEFSYLGEDAFEVVVKNPNQVVSQIEEMKPVPDGLYSPKIEGAEEQIQQMAYQNAIKTYGEPLPPIVQNRLDKELNSIISNGFSVIYLIAHKLVKKSLDDGYLVGSRGSVGSSFVATMCNITEVNPLPPHYRCSNCFYSEFITDGSYKSGFDLPNKECPRCGRRLLKDGQEIPFEVFLGFKGDKVPDIDLNFSGEYQSEVHKYTEELFGKDYVFRAGTIGTVAEKTAYGFVKGLFEETGLSVREAEIIRLVKGCTGVKRTTGQHPGGLMVVPKDNDIHNFTPIQYPANDKKAGTITTHFDYHSISSRLLKLDILGHDDPTVLRMLSDLTGVDVYSIPLDDPKTMSLFSSVDALGVTPEQIKTKIGTLAIPEFGTKFVRQMLEETRPSTFAELVRISGLSHGTDVWLNNAQEFIHQGIAQLADVISVRDDIMNYLMLKGMEHSKAFKIMERVRKGKGLGEEDIQEMRENNVPEWYIESCQRIKYMFPKAHAVAYVMMAFRIAYFKVHYPKEFYATYFSVRADEFDADLVARGIEHVAGKIDELNAKGNNATIKEKNLLGVLEVVLEAMHRGIQFTKVDLYFSDSTRFLIDDAGRLVPPLIALEGLGESAAKNIIAARKERFTSVEDLRLRGKVSKTVIDVLRQHGCIHGLPEENQLQLF
jgi:DNA polymerase-3 subunit alpha (Gram-positive type)